MNYTDVLAITFCFSLPAKIFIHYYVGSNNGKRVYLIGMMNPSFFELIGPYCGIVEKRYETWKRICNILFVLNVVLFMFLLINVYV